MLNPDSTRTICSTIREIYRYNLKNNKNRSDFNDIELLIRSAYVSAKKMNRKLYEYKFGKPPEDEESEWIKLLDLVKKEYE